MKQAKIEVISNVTDLETGATHLVGEILDVPLAKAKKWNEMSLVKIITKQENGQ